MTLGTVVELQAVKVSRTTIPDDNKKKKDSGYLYSHLHCAVWL